MNSRELRSGNIILVWSSAFVEYQEVAISAQHILNIEQGWKAQPIPLTEDWLIKFEATKIDYDWWILGGFALNKNSDGSFSLWCQPNVGYIMDLKYVHSTQNFFALTGEELLMK